jgi:Ca2+-binding RTX toxin-like protein
MPTIMGTTGSETLTGTAGSDTFDISQGGDDVVYTMGGSDDVVYVGGALTANDRIIGAGVSPTTGGINSVSVVLDGDYSAGVTFSATTFSNLTNLRVTAGHSYRLTSNDATMMHFYQYMSDLTVDGAALGTADTLYFDGSAETDAHLGLTGGAGSDTLIGGVANDVLTGGDGNDQLRGGDGNDALRGGAGNDALYSGDGDDTLDGGTGVNTLDGGAGNDQLQATNSAAGSSINAGSGDDLILTALPNGTTYDGGAGRDAIYVAADLNTRALSFSVNLATGTITDGTSTDRLISIEGAMGGAGNDTLTGDDGNNWLSGGEGCDVLEGGLGDDIILGEKDLAAPWSDSHIFWGGSYAGIPEIDTVSFAHAARGETVDPGADQRHPALPTGVAYGGDGLDTIMVCQNFVLSGYNDVFMGSPIWNYTYKVWGGDGNDLININTGFATGHQWDTGTNSLYGGNGDDVLIGGDSNLLQSYISKDVIDGGSGADTMTGGTGYDIFEFTSASDLSLEADHITDFAPGDDTLDFSAVTGLSFIGTAAFSGAAGQLRYVLQNGQTVLQLDADGDKQADGLLVLDNGAFALSETTAGSKILVADDGAAPVLVGLSPDNGSTIGGSWPPITLTFNEAVRIGSGKIGLYDASGLLFEIDAASSYVSAVGNTVTISGAFGFERGHSYYIKVSDGAIVDGAGHAFTGLSSPSSWTFTLTSANTGPVLQSGDVAKGSSGASLNPTITLTFDKPVHAISGTIMISNSQANTPFITISATDSSQVTVSGNSLIIKPTAALFGSTQYEITTGNLIVADAAGNRNEARIDAISSVLFTTVARQDTTAPTLISATPSSGSSVSPGANIVLTFSEAVRPGYTWSVTGLSYDNCFWITRASDGHLIKSISASDTSQVTISGNQVIINPNVDLPGDTAFIVSYGAYALQDMAGNFVGGQDISGLAPITGQFTATTFTTTSEINGTKSNDVLPGTAGNDVLSGLGGNDTLYGYAGNDTLRGGAGSNTLDGGAGTDTAAFAGQAPDYFVSVSGGVTTVMGVGETDTLTNIEKVSFDGSGQTLTLAEFQAQAFSKLQALEYIASYKDLMGAFGDDAVWGARHYFNNGKAEGRTISFSALNYICSYGDLVVAFHDDQLAATEHYLKNGSYEGRKVTFDPLAYVCSYSDLLVAFRDDQTAAAEHYIKNGYWENRKVTFDALAYVCSYDDLVIAFHNDKTAAEEHYIRNGYWEGRKVTFNALAYIASYTDLIGAFGTDVQAAEEHYIRNGFWEGRKVTFDPVAYLINNTDLGACGFTATDATEHYLKNGYWEHRTTNGAFGSEQTNHDLTVGGLVTDTIGTAGDKDWFAVNVTAGQTYTFTLSGVDGGNGTLADPFLSICDARGVQLTYANDSTNHDAVIRFTALSTGTCYLVASANDTGTGTYKLFATAGG